MSAGSQAVRGRHLPALDGLRALAVAGVMAYHLRLGWAAGGYLGVDLFFVLSGFLITALLLEEHEDTGRIGLRAFWGRRARRLLPGLLLLLTALAVAGAAGALRSGLDLRALRGDALATIAYGANWHELAVGRSYFAQFAAPSPLQHTWSLAIEEQFYLAWPLLLLGLLHLCGSRAGRGSPRRRLPSPLRGGAETSWRRPLLGATVVAAAASAAWMGLLAAHGAGVDRLYFGTDTRALDLLAGAALAAWCATRPDPGPSATRALHVAGPLAAAGLAVMWALAGTGGGPSRLMFEGGFALAAVGAVVVLADARLEDAGPLGRLLRLAPLRFIGRISYGLYLWHWPVVTELTSARTGLSGAALDLACVAATLALATTSYVAVEQPLRRARLSGWPRGARLALAPGGMAATALAVIALVPPATAQAAAGTAGPAGPATSVAGAGGLGGQIPVSLPAGRRPTPAHPLRVLLLGDSVMQSEAPALRAALQATRAARVVDRSFPGWGLSTDPGWPTSVPAMLAQDRPDLVVATWSWDDAWLTADPAGYRTVLERFIRLLLRPGGGAPGAAGVLFEEFPPLAGLAYAPDAAAQARRVAGARAWNALVATLPARFPGQVQFLPLGAAVERHGAYANWLPPPGSPTAPSGQWVRVRMIDQTHFCPAGAARYAQALAMDLGTLVGLPDPGTAWWSGPWQADDAFRTPADACPDDHPGTSASG